MKLPCCIDVCLTMLIACIFIIPAFFIILHIFLKIMQYLIRTLPKLVKEYVYDYNDFIKCDSIKDVFSPIVIIKNELWHFLKIEAIWISGEQEKWLPLIEDLLTTSTYETLNSKAITEFEETFLQHSCSTGNFHLTKV